MHTTFSTPQTGKWVWLTSSTSHILVLLFLVPVADQRTHGLIGVQRPVLQHSPLHWRCAKLLVTFCHPCLKVFPIIGVPITGHHSVLHDHLHPVHICYRTLLNDTWLIVELHGIVLLCSQLKLLYLANAANILSGNLIVGLA